ncbi:MAG TPA: endonuclease/exonuclease/phosphatase family protein [Steroidobacteraceae bacterium]
MLAVRVIIAAACASAAAVFARELWLAELAVHFRVQYAAVAVLALPCLLWSRRFGLAALALVVLGANLWFVGPLIAASPSPLASSPAPARKVLRVATANVFFINSAYARVIAWIHREQPDIVVLEEVTPRWHAALAPLGREYPYQSFADDDHSAVWLLSRWPLIGARKLEFGGRAAPAVLATAAIGAQRLQLVGVHLSWPFGARNAFERNDSFRQLARFARGHSEPLLIVGDLNCTPFSPYFGDLLRDGELVNAAAGWQPTWPSFVPPLGIAIDHVLLAHGVAVRAFRRGDWIGSDHVPIVVDLTL